MLFSAGRRERLVAAVLAEPAAGDLRPGILAPVSSLGVGVLLLMAHAALPRKIAQNKKASPEGPATDARDMSAGSGEAGDRWRKAVMRWPSAAQGQRPADRRLLPEADAAWTTARRSPNEQLPKRP